MNRSSWIIIIATFVICAIIGFFSTYKQVSGTFQMYRDIAKAKTNLSEITKKKEILDNLSKNNQLSDLYNIASKYIPIQADSSQLVLELSAIASQNNLKVEQFSLVNTKTSSPTSSDTTTSSTAKPTPAPNPTPTGDAISEIPFTMKLTGSFTDYLSFLNSLQTSSRLVSITAMNLTQDQTSFSSQITGKTYYKKATGLDQTLANITIPQDIINKFKNLKSYGTPLNLPTDSGFGRTDPFAGL